MGYVIRAKPGTAHGSCLDEGCGHVDCAAIRREAAAPCRACGDPIGYDTPFCYEDGNVQVHWTCLLEEVEG